MKKFFLFSLFVFLLAALSAEAKDCNGVGRCGNVGSQTTLVFQDNQGTEDSPTRIAAPLTTHGLRGRRPGRWHTH